MNSIVFSFIRPLKKVAMEEQYNKPFYLKERLEALSFNHAVVLPQREDPTLFHGIGGVVDQNGTFIEASGLKNQFGGSYSFGTVKEINKKVCFCGYLIQHWGHFLLDAVSRLWYALDHDSEIEEYVFVVPENTSLKISGNYAEFFELLGIKSKIRLVNVPIRFREVIIPERSYVKLEYYSEEFIQIFDKVSKNAQIYESDSSVEKVYLSRNHFRGKRIESGLDFVDHYFRKNGFEIVYPEEVTLSRLINLIRGASICASESGTLTHNFLFAQTGKEVIVVERQVTINDYQCNIDVIKDLYTTYIDANYEIYTTAVGYGPYFLGYTKCFQQFTKEKGFLLPDVKYTSKKYNKSCLRKYLKACEKEYGYKRQYASWQLINRRAIMEAYEEALETFRPWLEKKKPLFWWQYFQPSIIFAQIRNKLQR